MHRHSRPPNRSPEAPGSGSTSPSLLTALPLTPASPLMPDQGQAQLEDVINPAVGSSVQREEGASSFTKEGILLTKSVEAS